MNSKLVLFTPAVTGLLFCLSAYGHENPDIGTVYEERYIHRVCPPEYPQNLDYMIKVVEFGSTGKKLRRFFGNAAPDSIDDITLLVDEKDASACSHFRQLYNQLINKQARFYAGGEAEYWHDLTFYQSQEFYFIVIGGGFLIQQDPKDPENEIIGSSSVPPLVIYDKRSLEPVHIHFLEDSTDSPLD